MLPSSLEPKKRKRISINNECICCKVGFCIVLLSGLALHASWSIISQHEKAILSNVLLNEMPSRLPDSLPPSNNYRNYSDAFYDPFDDHGTGEEREAEQDRVEDGDLAELDYQNAEVIANMSTPSPYEVRNPGWYLPRWARKQPELRNVSIPESKRTCFVHIGKTAGSTMGCALGFRLHCASSSYREGLLSLYTTHVTHNGVDDCPRKTQNYLIPVRNPFKRIQSIHVYERSEEHRKNNGDLNRANFYDACPFWTLNDLAENGLDPNSNASAVCKERAYNHFHGREQFGYHAFFNYQYYYNSIDVHDENSKSKIYVVRTEHLVDDWNSIERLYGETREPVEDFGHYNPSSKMASAADSYLSEQSKTLLCAALCEEIQTYKTILLRAENLQEQDVAESLEDLAQSCPEQARMSSCPNENDENRELADPMTPSPYEVREPGWDLPGWASKKRKVRATAVPENKRMCFLHVGKTAGSSVGCALGFQLHCEGNSYVDGLLSRYTTHLSYKSINDCPVKTNNYLISLRNPFRRMQSIHLHERSTEHREANGEKDRFKLYDECPFWTLNELADHGLSPQGNTTAICKERAYNHLTGKEQFGFHAFYNYQHYYSSMTNDASTTLYAIRMEHLVDDWNRIESILGSNQDPVRNLTYLNPSSRFASDADNIISEESQRLLCAALCEEIQVYKKILREAVNLNEVDVRMSYDELALDCPKQVSESTCNSPERHRALAKQTWDSPYEARWPEWNLPWWATKHDDVLAATTVPKNQEICFIHVGKTAGSTMGCALGFQLHCNDGDYVYCALSRYTTHVFHNTVNDCPFNTKNYLFAVRNPLRRLQSIYVYERSEEHRKKNAEKNREKIYDECPFGTLNDLAESGLGLRGNASAVCKERAYSYVRGIEQFGHHAFHNYQFYYKSLAIDKSTKIYVVRTEHLVEDWNKINGLLGDTGEPVQEFDHNNPSSQLASEADLHLTSKAQRLLCNALCEEIQMYKQLLQDAVNLNEEDAAASVKELALSCPREARLTSCGDDRRLLRLP